MRTKNEQYLWTVNFYILRDLGFLPQPRSLSLSEAYDARYRVAGATRDTDRGRSVFQYTLSGHGRLRVNDDVFDLPKGSGLLCAVDDPNTEYFYPPLQSEPWRFVFLTFHDRPGLARQINREVGHVFKINPDSSMIKRFLDYGESGERVVELEAGQGARMVYDTLTTLIDAARVPSAENDANLKLIRRAHQLVDNRLFEPYNAGMLADELGVSQEHLTRVFRLETRSTPYELITNVKMRHACSMLRETSLSCRDIALKLGYRPGSNFARVFNRTMGVNPNEYRRRGVVPL